MLERSRTLTILSAETKPTKISTHNDLKYRTFSICKKNKFQLESKLCRVKFWSYNNLKHLVKEPKSCHLQKSRAAGTTPT